MAAVFRLASIIGLIVTASIGHSAERIEFILDLSNEMWRPLPDGTPRIVAARSAINAFLASPALADFRTEIGLSTIGGNSDISESTGCEDFNQILPSGTVELAAWYTALGDLEPRGGRPLVSAIEEAAKRLANVDGSRRIVVLTAGGDLCFRDINDLLDRLSKYDEPIQVRVIGIDLDQALASSLSALTPTRNASDSSTLLGFLKWAMLPAGSDATRPEWLDLSLLHGGVPLSRASLRMAGPTRDEESVFAIDQGRVRFRLPPGRYRATIDGDGFETIELAGVVHLDTGRAIELELTDAPSVTLEVDPERPPAGSKAHVQYWGAPAGDSWLLLAIVGSPPGDFLVRSAAPGSTGDVPLTLPDTPNDLEIRFATDVGHGVLQLLGRLGFESGRRRISFEAPERAEIRTPITVAWIGEGLTGDHITIDPVEPEGVETSLCIPAAERGQATITAPALSGEYVVRYLTRRGQTLARSSLEVFEVLATLDGPQEIAPGTEFTLHWTGPDAEQDYLSIASVGEADDQYRSFSPTSAGNPVRLIAPWVPGEYELRYIRAADGEVLAREKLAVVAVEIVLEVPPVVETGTLFEVSWRGTSGRGDFITIAREGSDRRKFLDSAYASLGSPVTLAAPFNAGRYVVRYISGESREIIVQKPIEAR